MVIIFCVLKIYALFFFITVCGLFYPTLAASGCVHYIILYLHQLSFNYILLGHFFNMVSVLVQYLMHFDSSKICMHPHV